MLHERMNRINVETQCLQYSALPICGFGTCIWMNNTRSELESSYSLLNYTLLCECKPGWYQTLEMSPFLDESVALESVPCTAHEGLLMILHLIDMIVSAGSLILTLCSLISSGVHTKCLLPRVNLEFAIHCSSGLAGIFLSLVADVYRFHDFKGRGLLIDFEYTTVLVSLWICARINKFYGFSRYVKYNNNPLRLPFVSEHSKRAFKLVSFGRSVGCCLQVSTQLILWSNSLNQGKYTFSIFEKWVWVYCIIGVLEALFSWVVFTNIIRDLDSMINSKIRRHSQNKQTTLEKLKRRKKEMLLQRSYHCGLEPLYCSVLFCCLSVGRLYPWLIYLFPADRIVFCLKNFYQIRRNLKFHSPRTKIH